MLAQLRIGFAKQPLVFAATFAVVLVALGFDAFQQPQVHRRLLVAQWFGCEAKLAALRAASNGVRFFQCQRLIKVSAAACSSARGVASLNMVCVAHLRW